MRTIDKQYTARCESGLTLVEAMLTVAIIALISSIAIPLYQGHISQARISVAIQDIRKIEIFIDDMWLGDGVMPESLAAFNINITDPWGNDYQYLDIRKAKGKGKVRKDKNLVPINSDYDLYSMGADGDSVSPLTAKASRDDIVRANNGRFVGLAEKY